MLTKSNIWNWIIVIGVVALLFANPFTRTIIKFLLPMGSGFDDFIEIVAIALLSFLLVARGWHKWQLMNDVSELRKKRNVKILQCAFVALVCIIALIVPYTSGAIWGLLLFGRPIQDITFYVVIISIMVIIVIGWKIIGIVAFRKGRK